MRKRYLKHLATAIWLAMLIALPVIAGVNSKLLTFDVSDPSFPNSLKFNPDSTLNVTTGSGNYNIAVGNHSASLLTSGTVDAARLPSNTAFTDAGNNWTASQVPNAVNSYDLGSTSKWWSKIYFGDDTSNYAVLDTESLTGNRTVTIPDANSTTVVADTGSSNNFLTAISATGAISKAQPSSSNLSDASNIALRNNNNFWSATQLPNAAGTIDLGSPTFPFGRVYAQELRPPSSGYDIGSDGANAAWRHIYFGGTVFGNTHRLQAATPTTDRFHTFPDADSNTVIPDTGAANNFLTGISSGGVISKAQPSSSNLSDSSNIALRNNGNSWSAAQVPNAAGTIDLGSTSLPFRDLYVRGAGANYTKITTASLNGNRTFTLPNADSNPVQPASASTGQFCTGINSSGVLSFAAPTSGVSCDGRLTLTSGTPVTTSDVTGAGTVYYTPYKGNRVAHSDGTNVYHNTFSQITISLSGKTANQNNDVFIYDSNGDGVDDTGELVAWTNNTTRATAVTYSLGVPVKNGAVTRTYVGTIRTTGTTGQCEDSKANRFVWNCSNRVLRPMAKVNTASSYTYSTKTWRQFNGGTGTIQVNFITGLAEDAFDANALAMFSTSNASRAGYVGIGLDSTSTNSAQLTGSNTLNQSTPMSINAHYVDTPSIGFHSLYPLEAGNGSITTTFYGTGNDSFASPGITANYPM